ncbi:MAG: GAF domain-containing protein [Halosimplex sp.]
MMPWIAVFQLVGAVGFLAGAAVAGRLYFARPLVRNYWFGWVVALFHLGLWALTGLLAQVGAAPVVTESVIPLLLLTIGLTALLHVAFYDNTGSERLLRELEVSEALNRSITDNYPDGAVALFDADLTVVRAGGEDVPGHDGPAEAVEGHSLASAFPESVCETVRPRCRAALDGETTSFEVAYGGSTYEARTLPLDDAPSIGDRPSGPVSPDGGGSRRASGGAEAGEGATVSATGSTAEFGLLVFRDVTERERRERRLREQRDELSTLDRINRVVRDVDHALVGADSREGVAEAVADRLAADDPYRTVAVAWAEGDRLRPTAWGGRETDAATDAFPAPLEASGTDPGARAVETGETQVVRDVGTDGGSLTEGALPAAGVDPWRRSARALGAKAIAVVPVRHDDRRLGVLAVYADRRDAFESRELAVLDQVGETVGHAVVSLERRERVTALADLHRATRALFHAETTAAVGEIVADVGADLLGADVALFAYDAEDHCLRLAAASEVSFDGLADVYGPEAETDRGSIAWAAFSSGESRTVDGPGDAGEADDATPDARNMTVVPLGDHGVLVATASERAAFDDRRRRLVDLLAATTEAALDRLESEADLREREADLRERNRRLSDLQRLNGVIRDVDQALVGAASRAAIEAAVCDRLTAGDRFSLAWVATAGRGEGGVERRAWAGESGAYLDAVSFDAGASPAEPTARTLETGEPTVVDGFADCDRSADWVTRGLELGIGSAVSVPLEFRDVSYGALTVYATRPGAFDERTTAVLGELADTVAYAINARETERGLLATGGTELKLVVRGTDSILDDLARAAEGPVRVVETRPGDGEATELAFVDGSTDASTLRERVDERVVESIEPVSDRDEDRVFRARVSGPVLPAELVELGALPREIEATPDEITAVVLLLPHVDARPFVERLRERYPSVELLARRERDSRALTRGAFLDEFESLVTDRQLEVLRTAYGAGYFDRPRTSSGQEIADRLGVSQPTVNYHLRESQLRLLSLLFGDEPADDERDSG